jgi:tRNA 2-thiouridine synthesizing protein B
MLTILHLIRCSAFSSNQLENCLATLAEVDSIVLLDDGCYSMVHRCLIDNIAKGNVYIVTEHATARGLEPPLKINNISLTELTELMFSHHSVVTWQ